MQAHIILLLCGGLQMCKWMCVRIPFLFCSLMCVSACVWVFIPVFMWGTHVLVCACVCSPEDNLRCQVRECGPVPLRWVSCWPRAYQMGKAGWVSLGAIFLQLPTPQCWDSKCKRAAIPSPPFKCRFWELNSYLQAYNSLPTKLSLQPKDYNVLVPIFL